MCRVIIPGYSESDRARFRGMVFRNIFVAMKAMLDAMFNFKIKLGDSSLENDTYDLMDLPDSSFGTITASQHALIKRLWADSGVNAVCF